MAPTALAVPTAVPAPTAPVLPLVEDLTDEDFVLDMRVFEQALTPRRADCDTSDGCGNTCDTTACTTSSYDPA